MKFIIQRRIMTENNAIKNKPVNGGETNSKKEGGKGRIFKIITTLLLLASIGLTTAGTFLSSKANAELTEKVGALSDRFDEEFNTEEKEDDVVIMDIYTIRSTLPISDAYRSGDQTALDDRQKETLSMASAILDEIITDGMSDYEKEKAVYEWLTREMSNETGHLTVIPNTGADSDNPYGVLKYRTAVCVGYATTFRMFMQMLGIDCHVVHSSDRVHSWDLVKLGGEWYHVDCYMDSDTDTYANFNMTDYQAGQGHDWNREFFPAANGTEFSYVMRDLTELDDFYAIPTWMKSKLDGEAPAASCYFKKEITEDDEAIAAALTETMISTLEMSAQYYNYSFNAFWSKIDKYGYVYSVVITPPSGDEPVPEDDVDYDMINEKISDAFGDGIFETSENYGDYGDYDLWEYDGTAVSEKVTRG